MSRPVGQQRRREPQLGEPPAVHQLGASDALLGQRNGVLEIVVIRRPDVGQVQQRLQLELFVGDRASEGERLRRVA